MDPILIVMLLWLLSAPIFFILWIRARKQIATTSKDVKTAEEDRDTLKSKYSAIVSIEAEVEHLKQDKDRLENDILETRKAYAEKRKLLDQ